MQGLKDIKGIVGLQASPLYLIILVVVVLLVVVLLAVFLKPKKRKKVKKTQKQIAYEKLKNIDFSDTKQAVYDFSQNYAFFVNQSNKVEFESFEKELEIYKYKKDIPNLSQDDKDKIKSFVGAIKC
ncbi:DUF6568 family protein [Campylobacter geochelonis]|uniref:Uncharacterized protein n=1 Tax=Campylobacter geochelonis TaxID=1780362 RepID=A0A128EEN1_9BACT|nr:DUF6568 family protein [Campylobacter geochelonis]QKF70938.1 hypothetical protein CGEO_0616 [Campylobacter geochelonis]CZE46997.1 Uncharacterised protein [Campylobacter geochelonis]CZE49103.1 Uncharacterised protein [Campylobacter geochelonis]CZE51215.1 Uncharacterised protein [Campylobacter geochelonis]